MVNEYLSHHKFTQNPAWYAVQALPYLMEYPYECTEQIFSRFYANSLATNVANAHPKIKTVFERWKNTDVKALQSNLTKNQELKTALLAETPRRAYFCASFSINIFSAKLRQVCGILETFKKLYPNRHFFFNKMLYYCVLKYTFAIHNKSK